MNAGTSLGSRPGVPFLPGLRYSADLLRRLSTAWRLIGEHSHAGAVGSRPGAEKVASSTDQFLLSGKIALYSTADGIGKAESSRAMPFFSHLAIHLTWPRILAEKLAPSGVHRPPTAKGKPHAGCNLIYDMGQRSGVLSGLSQLRVQNLMTEEITCRLTFSNPTEKPLFIQVILLDELIPATMNYSEMVQQMPLLSDELFSAAQLSSDLMNYPRYPAQRSGRFTSRMDATSFDDDSLASLRAVLFAHGLQNVVLPTCCSVYVLPPNGGYAVYSVTFTPGAFHNGTDDATNLPRSDNSILLVRNNLTSLETVLLRTVTQTASLTLRGGLLDSDMEAPQPHEQTDGRAFIVSGGVPTKFPTALGSPYDAEAGFNPSLGPSTTCSLLTAKGQHSSLDIGRYDLRASTGEILCPLTTPISPTTHEIKGHGMNHSMCRVAVTPLPSQSQFAPHSWPAAVPEGAVPSFEFAFHEGHLSTLCEYMS